MIFHGRGRSTASANGSNKSQTSTTSSGRVREHQGGVSLREDKHDGGASLHEDVKHHGGASLRENTEDTEQTKHVEQQGGAPLVDNKDHEGGVSLRKSDNEPAKGNKEESMNVSMPKSYVEAASSSAGSNTRFSQRQKASSVSNHRMEDSNNKHTPIKPYGFNMAARAFNNHNKGFGQRTSLAGQYAGAQRQTARLAQSNSAPVLPMIASPPQSSMGHSGMRPGVVNGSFYAPLPPTPVGGFSHPMMPTGVPPPTPFGTPYATGAMNNTVPTLQMGGTPGIGFVQPGNAHPTPYGTHVYHHAMASRNVGVQSTPAYNHVAPVNNGPVHGNVGPVPGGNGPYGHSTHGNYHTGLNISAATAPGSYVNHNSNIDNAQTGYPVGRSDPVVIPHNIIGAAHGTHLVHSSSAGMVVPSNVGAPTPTHAGPQVKYFVNDVTGDKMTLDGTIWTPYGGKKDLFADSSYYNQTEPRNFAPRPMGSPIMFPPPPNFGFAAGANNQAHEIVSSVSMYDPFLSPTSPAIHSVNRAAVSQVDCYEFAYGEPNENEQEICHRWGLLRHKLPELRKMGSDGLKKLIDGYMGIPSEGVLLSLDNFPFIESSSQAMPVAYGVIKIGNIPFGTLRSEVIAFLGRNSKILNDALEPIHIIMERVTSKTGDAFIEFPNHHAACRALDRHSEAIRKHRHPRLGDRPVEMTLSSQKELMEALFPWCRGVRFTNQGRAEMLPFDEVNPWNVFRGFVTEEEMNLVIKHVEVPSRSPYSKDCPQRPFESMISTLKKLPWYRSDVITLKQRQVIYDATCRLLELLAETLLKEDRPVNNRRQENVLNEQLYKRLVNAAMICPGFSVLQKDNIAFIADLDGSRVTQFNMPPFADCWGHLYNLCPRPRVPVDLLEWYISLIREETVRFVGTLPEHEQDAIKERAQEDTLYFGYMWYEIQLPQGKELADMTLREVAKKELEAIKRALRRAATLARNPRAIEGVRHEGHPPVV